MSPIRPENRHYYRTDEWRAAKAAVVKRAGGRCEQCGARNGVTIIRLLAPANSNGRDWETPPYRFYREYVSDCRHATEEFLLAVMKEDLISPRSDPFQDQKYKDSRLVRIVLTVAHLDQNPANNSLDNLKHLCQQCHNRLDAPHRSAGIKRRKRDQLNVVEMKL